MDSLSGWVIEDMKKSLAAAFTQEEVVKALKQMHPNKAPGPDGMAPIFFLTYWDIIDQAITEAMVNTLN